MCGITDLMTHLEHPYYTYPDINQTEHLPPNYEYPSRHNYIMLKYNARYIFWMSIIVKKNSLHTHYWGSIAAIYQCQTISRRLPVFSWNGYCCLRLYFSIWCRTKTHYIRCYSPLISLISPQSLHPARHALLDGLSVPAFCPGSICP